MTEAVTKDSRAIVKPDRDIVASTADELRRKLRDVFDAGVRELVIDCADTGTVDSIGLGLLISAYNSLQKVGGNLVLTNVSEDLRQIITLMRLNRYLSVLSA